MLTLLTLFIVGPLLGLVCVAPLTFVQQNNWREKRLLMWTAVAGELLALLLLSGFFGSASLVLALPMVLAGSTYLACKNDASFAKFVGAASKRSFAALQVLVFGAPKNQQPDDNDDSDEFVQPVSPAHRETAVHTPEPQVKEQPVVTLPRKVRPADREQPRPTICPMPQKPLTEQQVLEALLVQVGRLQQWAARPEAERVAVAQLTDEARSTEGALNAAVLQLQTGTVNWKDICAHIEGLKRHELPVELSGALDGLVAERAGKLDSTRHNVGELSEKLRSTAGELKKKLEKPVLSPEDVIRSADEALNAADQVSASTPQ